MCRCGNKLLRAVMSVAAALLSVAAGVCSPSPGGYRTRSIGTYDGLPGDNVQQVYQDSEGYLWFATRNGLARYDGSSMDVFKSDMRRGDILTDNSINCVAEDSLNRLWIGTFEGLNYYDKRTATLHKISRPEFKGNPISCILPTRSGRLFLGTDQGMYEYIAEKDSLILFTRELSKDVMLQTTVKSLLEDSRGHIWIGTWNEGIYRMDSQGRFYAYPRINERKSAHVIFEDSRHRIWVGSWGCGLMLLRNPYEPDKATWENFRHEPSDPTSLCDNIIYSISEDPTHTLWVGTRKGVSMLADGSDTFTHIYSDGPDFSVREVTSIMRDRLGVMWISMLGQGALALTSGATGLFLDRLDTVRNLYGTNSVQRLMVDKNGRIWISLGSNSGLAIYDPRDGSVTSDPHYAFSAASPTAPYTVQCIRQLSDERVMIGTYDGGLYILSPDGRSVQHYSWDTAGWVAGNRVSEIFEDKDGRLWLGALPGLTVVMPDGSYCRFDSLVPEGIHVNSIVQAADGGIWIGTKNMGVLRIEGSGTTPADYSVKRYNPETEGLNSALILTMYCDAMGRLWAGTDGAGLSLYNYKADSFVPVHMKWNLPGDIVSSILGDKNGNLWIGSNMGLYRLSVSADTSVVNFRVFTSGEGAQDNVFNRNAAFRDSEGRLFFGGPHGLNVVTGDLNDGLASTLPVTITDIKVYGTSWERLPEHERLAVSELAPGYSQAIHLDASHNNFSIEFAVLDFVNHPLQHKYAYRLDGFDSDWQSPDPSRRFAYYNNLPSGTYTFRVKTSDAEGRWSGSERTLKVTIEPPLWATWWAKLIYMIFFGSLVWAVVKVSRRRVRRQNELHLRELELAQAEQLNRDKLRFFTNVTHEWLTPLSIISAVAEEMKGDTPEQKEYHRIMMTSVGRLSRLLQQVLEFRKAESGNLRLRVSEGNLAAMVGEAVESIMPVMKAKGITCSYEADSLPTKVWFDPDKFDKILYNLLSNAAKYVHPGGDVRVRLTYDSERAMAALTVADNGPGIPASRLPDLFKRFYVGEHRYQTTSGNGIGLSLTKDLVELHRGTIEAHSVEGHGTEFRIEIPIKREAYAESEIDTMPSLPAVAAGEPEEPASSEAGGHPAAEKVSLLVIEDDADLLRLMAQLLSHDYNVITASSAEEAMDLLSKNDVSLIITDMMMPGLGGAEFCRWAKGRIESCHIPILLLTANTLEEAEVEAYEAGADAFMPKPFSIAVLQARVSNLLRIRNTANRNFREQIATDVHSFDYSTLDENFLQKSVECITAHIGDADYSQTMFAEEMGVTKSTLFRKLKSLTGLSYSSFVRNIRLKTACRIMEEKRGIRISELAYAVGFNDSKYFSLCFKKEFGMLPTEYIERFIDKKSI